MDISPFSISPNPLCLHITSTLRSTIAKAQFCIEKRQGLNTIMGDVGLGKSTILRYLHAEYSAREDCVTTLIPTPIFSSEFAFLKSVAQDFGLPPKPSLTAQMEVMQTFFIEQLTAGRNCIVFIDEGQKLTAKMLELIQSLLNWETNEVKLMQIVIAAQLELRENLLKEKNKPLYSRVIAPSVLDPLSLDETKAMIEHRLRYYQRPETFEPEAQETVYRLTFGVPRNVLKLCALAYEMAQMQRAHTITAPFIEASAAEYGIEELINRVALADPVNAKPPEPVEQNQQVDTEKKAGEKERKLVGFRLEEKQLTIFKMWCLQHATTMQAELERYVDALTSRKD